MFKEGSTRFERNTFKNNLRNVLKDDLIGMMDVISFAEDIHESLKMLHVFNWLISSICFTLSLFQLIVSISANIRDLQWQIGVLR